MNSRILKERLTQTRKVVRGRSQILEERARERAELSGDLRARRGVRRVGCAVVIRGWAEGAGAASSERRNQASA